MAKILLREFEASLNRDGSIVEDPNGACCVTEYEENSIKKRVVQVNNNNNQGGRIFQTIYKHYIFDGAEWLSINKGPEEEQAKATDKDYINTSTGELVTEQEAIEVVDDLDNPVLNEDGTNVKDAEGNDVYEQKRVVKEGFIRETDYLISQLKQHLFPLYYSTIKRKFDITE